MTTNEHYQELAKAMKMISIMYKPNQAKGKISNKDILGEPFIQ